MNKANLLMRIGELVREKRLEGISDIRDESDKRGMRVVIELKRGEVPEIILNNLCKVTQLQDTFGMNMVALVDGQPRLLNLKQFLEAFLRHRREVVTRRTVFELRKARERGHVLEGLAVALSNVDEVIALIKAAATPGRSEDAADGALLALDARRGDARAQRAVRCRGPKACPPSSACRRDGYRLSDVQAQRILEMRLQSLTGARAGQDRRRVPRGDGEDRRPARHPREARARHADHPRRARRDQASSSATSAAARSSRTAQDLVDRGPDRAARTWWSRSRTAAT